MRQAVIFLLFAASSAFGHEIAVSDPTFEAQPVESAQVAASGDRFITVWGRGNNSGVFFSITDFSGTLQRGPLTLSLTGGHPAIAAGANGSLVAWIDGNSIYTAMIDKDGNAGARTLLISRPLLVGPASVVWNGSRFLVLIRTAPAGVIGFMVDANGDTISDSIPISDWTAVATADDSGFLVFATVAVDQSHPEKGFTIQARRIDATGAMSAWTQTTTEVVTLSLPSLAAAGRALFWQHGGVLHRVATDSNGAPLSDSIVATDMPFELQKAIDTPSGTLLALFEFAPRWWLVLVGSDGKLIARRDVPFSSDVAAIGTRALLVASNAGPLRGYFADATSTLQISGPINIGQMAANQLFPQVASNGALLLAAWIEPSAAQIFAARVDLLTEKHLDGRGIALDSQVYTGAPAVAALGDGFVVAYLEVSSGVAHLKIRRVFADGTLDAAPTLISTTAQPFPPRLASDGNQALLIWTENTYKVRGTRISSDGVVIDPAFLKISDGDSLPLQFAPDVGIDGDSYLVAWQAQRTVPIQIRTSAVHVTRSGVILDPPAPLPMSYSARVAGNTVAGTNGADVILDSPGQPPVDLGTRGFGDIEPFGRGILVVGPDPQGLWAAVVEDQTIENRFTIVLPAAASQPSLTGTPSGVAVTYLHGGGDEGFGGSMRAYVLPISERRRRPALPAR